MTKFFPVISTRFRSVTEKKQIWQPCSWPRFCLFLSFTYVNFILTLELQCTVILLITKIFKKLIFLQVEHLNLTQNGFGKAAFDVVKNCLKNIKELILTKYVVTCHGLQEDGEVVSKRRLKANVGLEDNVSI